MLIIAASLLQHSPRAGKGWAGWCKIVKFRKVTVSASSGISPDGEECLGACQENMKNLGWRCAACIVSGLSLLVSGCGGGTSSTPPPPVKATPIVTVTPSSASVSAAQPLTVTVGVNAGNAKPTGSVTLTSGSYTSPPATLSNGAASINVLASALVVGSDTLTAAYTPDTASSSTYNNATGTAQVTVTAPITSIAISPSTATIGAQVQFVATINGAASNSVNWTVAAPSGSGLNPGNITSTGLYTTPYPAPASITVTATSTTDSTTTGSITVTLSQPVTATGPTLLVDAGNQTHAISPFIYGINGYLLDSTTTTAAHPGLVRWGGDGSSRYNYKTNISNSALRLLF